MWEKLGVDDLHCFEAGKSMFQLCLGLRRTLRPQSCREVSSVTAGVREASLQIYTSGEGSTSFPSFGRDRNERPLTCDKGHHRTRQNLSGRAKLEEHIIALLFSVFYARVLVCERACERASRTFCAYIPCNSINDFI